MTANRKPEEPPSTSSASSRPPVRRSQETRTREARERILAATLDVLNRCGYGGLTTKEVANSAGVSNGALMHHFNSKAELVSAATEAIYEAALERSRVVLGGPEVKRAPLDAFIAECIGIYFDWPFIAALELIVAARTDPDLMTRIRPIMEHYRETTNARWLAVFRAAGLSATQASRVLAMTLNLVRGMAVNRLWNIGPEDHSQQLREWKRILHAQIKVKI